MVIKTISFKGYGIQQRINSTPSDEPEGDPTETPTPQFLVLGEDGKNPDADAIKSVLDALAGKSVKYLEYSFETIGYPDGSKDNQTAPISHTVRCYPVGYTNTKNSVSPTWMFMLPNNASMEIGGEIETKFFSNIQTLTLTPRGASFTLGGGLPMAEALGHVTDFSKGEEVDADTITAEPANSCMFFPAGTIMYNNQEGTTKPVPWTLSFMIYYQ